MFARNQVGNADAELQKTQQTPDKKIIRDYNCDDYREFWKGEAKRFLHEFEVNILQKLRSRQPGWFIDVGSGYGRMVPVCLRPHRKIVLVDYAINHLEMAAATYLDENIFFVAANAYYLPFRSESFDAGISIRTFHHINDPRAFLKELGRIMRKDSNMALEYSNKRSLFRLIKYGRNCFRHDHEEYGNLVFGTHPTFFAELAQEAGFRLARVLGTGFFDRLLEKFPFLKLPLYICETTADSIFGPLNLAPLTFVELTKFRASEAGLLAAQQPKGLMDIIRCPGCHGAILSNEINGIRCHGCDRLFPKSGRIVDLRYLGE
jgi:ubiquinone/menaquinone biosynthesis C-methylase UbiE